MENQSPKAVRQPSSERGMTTLRVIVLIAMLAVIGGVVWYAGSRIRELDRDLAASKQRAEELNERLRAYSNELERAIERARVTRQRADSAESEAEQTGEALREAQQHVKTIAEEKQRALEEASAAHAESAQTKEELAQVRRRRLAELDRMQKALNKIAPTKRTPSGMVMMLSQKDFLFDFDKASIRPENREMLSRIAGVLLASNGYRLFIDGHTDDVGDDAYNQRLSERRAKAVRDYLVGAGIPAAIIQVKGFGKRQPLVKGTTKAARAKNRRVEIGIVDAIITYEKPTRK